MYLTDHYREIVVGQLHIYDGAITRLLYPVHEHLHMWSGGTRNRSLTLQFMDKKFFSWTKTPPKKKLWFLKKIFDVCKRYLSWEKCKNLPGWLDPDVVFVNCSILDMNELKSKQLLLKSSHVISFQE